MHIRYRWLTLIVLLIITPNTLFAQDGANELAATLEVLSPGVDVLRVNTVNWVTVNVEAIVGVGDTIRTDDTGRARITFFADGTDTELLPNTEYRIKRFETQGEAYNLTVEVVIGQTTQRLSRLLDANSSYDVTTPGMTLAARGTNFSIRVEQLGRSAMLVTEGAVNAATSDANADVPAEFGIRSAGDSSLSDIVRASTFDELDAAIDGCTASIQTQDDVRLNVRIGASLEFARVGSIDPAEITRFIGVTESGNWYRLEFRGGFGWVLSSSATIESGCAGLRTFPDRYGPEDVSLYSVLGDEIRPEDIISPTTATPPN